MDNKKMVAIQQIVDSSIKSFADGFELRYNSEVNQPNGVINSKKNNCFIAELGKEFMFYSAFVRSFDSSLGKVLENMGNSIAKLSYQVNGRIDSYLLPQQSQHMDFLMTEYENHVIPKIKDYSDFSGVTPKDITSYLKSHETDNYFFNAETNEHYIIELKAGGDLDNKKAKAEKIAMLQEYFLLKNKLKNKPEQKIKIFFATAYNKFGEGNEWKQANVRTFFAEEELLIGRDYWNFVCNDNDGFNIVINQYKNSAKYINNSIEKIKNLYF
ncbi:MAG TPA: TdeIII family type II restriction endonuclease [Ruminococcus sp.]|nr:TdeIII family type II restriction endonuclease [Ruminococcus sp.]HCR74731.1 TdeIII family type II restriction endonuclease [Ruminococcus sp.]